MSLKFDMTELAQGVCQFKIITDISKKTNKPYKAIKLNFNGYELRGVTFINDDQLLLIQSYMNAPKKTQ